MIRKHNRLINEKSPYLLQHAYNPVDWFPWGPEAFDKAKREQKPVFLSIGYSTCHWCHVMERESFEDEEIAALLNDHFIAIKVDREERPDIDSIYMEVCTRQSGQGGWPLNAFLTPDQKPFYIGTYFPKESKYGRPGMMDILPQLAEIYENEPERIREIGDELTEALKPQTKTNAQELPVAALHNAFTHLNQLFDSEYGGFGGAPKFPSPGQLLFLLRYYNWTEEKNALLMVEKTLQSIADGGLYDQIGGGFARYSTDEKWLVPHFEKMLYDQAHLLTIYTEAYQITHNPRYKAIVYQTAEFLKREMTHPASGFYSAIDADSEGEEGTYYIWTKDEIVAQLGPDTADLFCDAYAISQKGNFEGKNIPNLIGTDFNELASKYAMSLAEVDWTLYSCRKQLLEEREKRVYPHLDDKILTSWNGLMIAALAKAGATFSEPDFSEMAERAARFIEKNVWKEEFLYARFRDGEAKFLGYVDDYAYLLWGYIELHLATGSPQYLERAVSIADSLFQRFEDKEQGGFFFTDQDAETLLIREKNALDGAMLSGNGVAALQLWRLAKLTADKTLADKADHLITTFADEATDYPTAVLSLLMARIAFEMGGKEIVISGYSTAEKEEILHCLQSTFHPYDVWIEATKQPSKEIASLAKGKFSEEKPLVIHVCENAVCGMPVYAKEKFLERL